jgi:hypothetical protein
MLGVYNRTHFELDEFVDLKSFDAIQVSIWKGIATAKSLANHGYLVSTSLFDKSDLSYEKPFISLIEAYREYLKLDDSDPIKVAGVEITKLYGNNELATFLKYAYKAHDLGSHYLLWDHFSNWRSFEHQELTLLANHFPELVSWINNLTIFSKIGRAYIIAFDSNGCSHEHRDPVLDPDLDKDASPEFIHIRPNLKRPFYVYNPETKQKHYINSRVCWWNDKDLHGGDATIEPSYAVRLDGVFTDEFRTKLRTK